MRGHTRSRFSLRQASPIVVLLLLAVVSLILQDEVPTASLAHAGQLSGDTRQTDVEAIKNQIATYLRSIDDADTKLASEVWSNSPDVSFIHPRGHERGWAEVKKNSYEGTMAVPFSERRLNVVGDVTVHVYGDAAWTEFYWDFVAKFRKGGTPLNTKGRETQVFRKENGGWRLVHVHYSGMPVGGNRRGF